MPTEFLLYISHLTPRRIVNLAFCWLGFALSYIIRKPILLGGAYSVSVEPSALCNLKCPECPTGNQSLDRNQGNMSLPLFKQVVGQVAPKAITILLHFQGEPMLCPHIVDMVSYTTERGLVSEMATNATLITPSSADALVGAGLKKIVLTIDSPNEDDSGFYRKGSTTRSVLDSIGWIQDAKRKRKTAYPLIVLELLALKENLSSLADFVELAKRCRVDGARVKTVNLTNPQDAEALVPLGTKFSRYRKTKYGPISLKGKHTSLCSAPWFKLSVTHDGWVLPCCFDKDGYYTMGNASSKSIGSIWRDRSFKNFRGLILTKRRSVPVCSSCALGRTPTEFWVNIRN